MKPSDRAMTIAVVTATVGTFGVSYLFDPSWPWLIGIWIIGLGGTYSSAIQVAGDTANADRDHHNNQP